MTQANARNTRAFCRQSIYKIGWNYGRICSYNASLLRRSMRLLSIVRLEVCEGLRITLDPSCCSYPRTEVIDFAERLICYSKKVRAARDTRLVCGMTIQSVLTIATVKMQ